MYYTLKDFPTTKDASFHIESSKAVTTYSPTHTSLPCYFDKTQGTYMYHYSTQQVTAYYQGCILLQVQSELQLTTCHPEHASTYCTVFTNTVYTQRRRDAKSICLIRRSNVLPTRLGRTVCCIVTGGQHNTFPWWLRTVLLYHHQNIPPNTTRSFSKAQDAWEEYFLLPLLMRSDIPKPLEIYWSMQHTSTAMTKSLGNFWCLVRRHKVDCSILQTTVVFTSSTTGEWSTIKTHNCCKKSLMLFVQ